VPRLYEFYPDICLTTEEKVRKTLSQGKKNLSQVKKNLSHSTDDVGSGRPVSISTPEMIERVRQIIREGRRHTTDEVSMLVGISHGNCHKMLTEGLKTRLVATRDCVSEESCKPIFFCNRFTPRDCVISFQTSVLSVLKKIYLNPGPQKYTVQLHSICSVYILDISIRVLVKKRAVCAVFCDTEKNSLL
jgi:hypothetical protein